MSESKCTLRINTLLCVEWKRYPGAFFMDRDNESIVAMKHQSERKEASFVSKIVKWCPDPSDVFYP